MDPRKLSAQELVRFCLASRDQALWVEFVRRFQPLIAGVTVKSIFRHTGRAANRSLVDDLVQDTFLKMCRNDFKILRKFEFRHENALHGFLKVVTAHVVEDDFRKKNSVKEGGGRGEEDLEQFQLIIPAPSDSPESMERRILFEEVKARLQELAAEPNFTRDSTIFWLYYRDGLTAQAISQLPGIGLTVKGVESTLLRLIKWLRDKLK
jgi:RNA polymerase sigma-70 factor (ECF subfamily)